MIVVIYNCLADVGGVVHHKQSVGTRLKRKMWVSAIAHHRVLKSDPTHDQLLSAPLTRLGQSRKILRNKCRLGLALLPTMGL